MEGCAKIPKCSDAGVRMVAVSRGLFFVCVFSLIVIMIGLVAWVAVLKGDISEAAEELDSIRIELNSVADRLMDVEKDAAVAAIAAEHTETNIAEHISMADTLLKVDLTATVEKLKGTHVDVGVLKYRLSDVEKSLAVVDDQMQTIMGDHEGFADTLVEIGKASALPSGERRGYGGYGN